MRSGRESDITVSMADLTRTRPLTVDAQTAWDYLSEVSNLPSYFDSLTSAVVGKPGELHVTAETPGGHQEGDAWLRADDSARRLEWGSENPDNDYSGWIEVHPDGDGCRVELGLHMQREDEDDSIGTTLDNLARNLEGGQTAKPNE